MNDPRTLPETDDDDAWLDRTLVEEVDMPTFTDDEIEAAIWWAEQGKTL